MRRRDLSHRHPLAARYVCSPVILEAIKDDSSVTTITAIEKRPGRPYADIPDCHQPGTLHKKLIVAGISVELHRAGLWLSHEDRQLERSTDGKPDL